MRNIYLKEKEKSERQRVLSEQPRTLTSNEQLLGMTFRCPTPYLLHNNKVVKSSLKSANVASTFRKAPTIFNILCNDKTKRTENFKTGL